MPRRAQLLQSHTKKPQQPTQSTPHSNQVDAPQSSMGSDQILQLQRIIGNRATSQVIRQSIPSGTIQRNPELIASLQTQISEREERNKTLKGKSRQRNNAQIKKLREQLTALRSNGQESTPEPEAQPEATKEPTYAEQYPELAVSFKEDEIKALVEGIGESAIKTLTGIFSASELKEMYDAFGATGITDLPKQFGNDLAVNLVKTLTVSKLADLMSAYQPAAIKKMVKDLGIDALKDLMSTFTGEEFKDFVSVIGAPRLVNLMKTRNLKASALKKYGAAWLKTFVGANQATMNHLVGINQRNDSGVITGGHDSAVFRPFLAQIIGSYVEDDQEYKVKRGQITNSTQTASYEKVTYKTFTDDGYDWATGSKTLIKNLQANKAAWLKKANEAIWNAIAAETFDPDVGAWSGTSNDGTTFDGFYNRPKVAVDTFFPV